MNEDFFVPVIISSLLELTFVLMVIYFCCRLIYFWIHGMLGAFFRVRGPWFTHMLIRNDDSKSFFFIMFPIAFWWYVLPYVLVQRASHANDYSTFFDPYGIVRLWREEQEFSRREETERLRQMRNADLDSNE